jgi:hypothetical protein
MTRFDRAGRAHRYLAGGAPGRMTLIKNVKIVVDEPVASR